MAPSGSGDQRTLVIETTEALRALQDILLFTDIPTRQRVQMVQAIQQAHPLLAERAKKILDRLGKQGNGPRYEIFYSVRPLVDFVHEYKTKLDTLGVPQLTKLLILALRLSTLLRSVDLAQMTTGLFTFEGKFFVRLVDKNSKHRTQPVCGPTLTILVYYLFMTRIQPVPFLLRHTNNPSLCLGSDRIARLCLQQMTECGVDTEVFKAHSLRGAAATYLPQLGVPQSLVQAHGFWSSTQTLDEYYPRLHMVLNWDDMLQGAPAPDTRQPPTDQGTPPTSTGNLVPAVVPSPSSGSLEATTEAGKGTDKGTAQQLEQLSALGIVRGLHSPSNCPRCNTPVKREAAHICTT